MSATAESSTLVKGTWHATAAIWAPVVLGLLVMLTPTYVTLATGAWNTPEQAHGAIVFVLVLWLFWHERAALINAPYAPSTRTGAAALGLGALFYVVGRSQGIPLFEVGAQVPTLVGLLLILKSRAAVTRLWFPLLFMIFLIPVPGFILVALTGPLKHEVSVIVEQLLYLAGYPIARQGVLLSIGQYQLLVADACSGLQSIYSLSAMGLFYIYLTQRGEWRRTACLLACIVPIAFAANIIRVLLLVLLTYYLGDEAGQSFLHDFAGVILFVTAILLLVLLDSGLTLLKPRNAA
jgi:exosortase B